MKNRAGHFWYTLLILLATFSAAVSQEFTPAELMSPSELLQVISESDSIEDVSFLSEAHLLLAHYSLYGQPNTDDAIRNYLSAIYYFEQERDSVKLNESRMELARLYQVDRYYEESLSLYEQALFHYVLEGDTLHQAIILNQMGDVYLDQNELARAITYLEKASHMNQFVKDSILAKINKLTLQTITKSGDKILGIADSFYLELRKNDSLSSVSYYSTVIMNNALHYMYKKDYGMALYYFQIAARAALNNPVRLIDIYRFMSENYRLAGDYKTALEYLTLFSNLNDSIFNEGRMQLLKGLTYQQNELQKREEMANLERDKNIAQFRTRMQKALNYALIFGAIIMLIVSYLIIRNYQQRLNTNQIIGRQKEEITKQRITDLENNLKIETMHSMISGQEAERERIAKDLHDSLGGLLSTIKLHFDAVQGRIKKIGTIKEYQQANMLLDEACKEIRSISNNMQPGALLKMGVVPAINDLINRLQGEGTPQIEFQSFGINGNLDKAVSLNIYRIVQELLYNSLKHADAQEILIQLIQKDNEMMVMVEDDGIGYDSIEVTKGMGTENIASRVNYLKGDLSIHSVKGTGTTTMVNIEL